jgi:hypothetical protein
MWNEMFMAYLTSLRILLEGLRKTTEKHLSAYVSFTALTEVIKSVM